MRAHTTSRTCVSTRRDGADADADATRAVTPRGRRGRARWRSRYFNRERARDVAKTRSGRAREGDARTNADDGGDEATREDWRLTEIREVLSTA